MPGRKGKNNRRRNLARLRERLKKMTPAERVVYDITNDAQHPLQAFPTAIVGVLMMWKREFDDFESAEKNLNVALRSIHVQYFNCGAAMWHIDFKGIIHRQSRETVLIHLQQNVARLEYMWNDVFKMFANTPTDVSLAVVADVKRQTFFAQEALNDVFNVAKCIKLWLNGVATFKNYKETPLKQQLQAYCGEQLALMQRIWKNNETAETQE